MLTNKSVALALCLLVGGCSSIDIPGFGSNNSKLAKAQAAAAKMPEPAVTQAWLDDYEPKVREAIKGTNFELERRENLLVVTAPVQGSFNPDRPNMMLPVTLGPLTRMAKLLEQEKSIGVLVLGHADSSGDPAANRELSQQRARAFTSIFRMSGLKQDRLTVKGMGSNSPRAANDSAEGRALNRRVEILLTSKVTLNALIAKYSLPDLQPATALASADKPAAAAPAKAKAASKPAAKSTKPAAKSVAKAKPAAKPAAKTPAKAVAKTTKPAAKDSKAVAKADKPADAKQ
ncbi:OmpA family protein [Pseudomonas sp. 5P_3.1_Bac2]|uniref:OmpA family protein n=1 Tax=Pseudomonas sp. 5P_3.1_Bac2 TaxID=2971617 RepID=UPI0021C9E852|nr:OmpA family protein [Pseudomonas sp. 5P_3.1_Bac2]MCU1716094.1 OmpA family protein [Pseudomonas sp. 5P_3.1_Bac2]